MESSIEKRVIIDRTHHASDALYCTLSLNWPIRAWRSQFVAENQEYYWPPWALMPNQVI